PGGRCTPGARRSNTWPRPTPDTRTTTAPGPCDAGGHRPGRVTGRCGVGQNARRAPSGTGDGNSVRRGGSPIPSGDGPGRARPPGGRRAHGSARSRPRRRRAPGRRLRRAAERGAAAPVPDARPGGRPPGRLRAGARRALAGRRLLAEPRHVLHHLGRRGGPAADGREPRQEHDRQGRVPADRGDRIALRANPRRPVALARRAEHRGLLHHRLQRGGHARRPGAEVAVAGAPEGRRRRRLPAQPGVRAGPDLLGEVRPLLRRGAAPGPLEQGATGLRPHQLRGHVDENTIGVVGILGVTYTCDYEPIAGLAAELDAIQHDTGLDVPLHVDAASGGFVAPFCQPGLEWDFRLERVASINASGHKYGLAPLGVGWAVWRTADLLPEDLVFRVDYLGG